MLLVALTGNIAAGKSAVAGCWQELGTPVIDADAAARAALAPGTPGAAAVLARFGPTIVAPDGTIDRPALGRLVFDDPAARRALEAIVHPQVSAHRDALLAEHRARGTPLLVCDVPLLFEAHLAFAFPRVVVVQAPVEVRVARLMAHRGLTDADARARVAAQLPAPCQGERADVVIDNRGTLADLVASATAVHARLAAEARTPLVATPAQRT